MHENTPSRADLFPAALIALSILSLLAPLPRPRAVSESPWLVELASMLALAGVFVFYSVRDKNFLGRLFVIDYAATMWIVRLLALFTAWSLLSALWARVPYLTVHHALLWGEYILIFLFFRERLSSGNGYRLVAYSLGIIAALLGILCIIEYATLPDFTALEGVIRLRYGAFAELLVTIVPVLAALAIAGRERGRTLLSIAAGLGWLTVMLSLSKGAFLAGIVGFVVAFAGMIFFGDAATRRRTLAACSIWLAVTIAVQAAFSLLSPIPATVDYISGKADPTRSTALARVFVWKIGAQMAREHPGTGVGSDNFGVSFNDARADYRKGHADNPPDEPVSDNLIERGHNELLQVAAELGVLGLLLFVLPFAWFGWQLVKRFRNGAKTLSPVFWATLGGMAAFFVSSMVSSFSFRLAQNGIAFFIVMAIATVELRERADKTAILPSQRFAPALVAMFFLLSIAVYGTKGYAEHCVLEAGREPDIEKAAALYDRAVFLDPGYASAYLQRSGRYYGAGDFTSAAAALRKAIDGGCGVVITYSALAASYEKSGDRSAAERAFNEALRIYPRSVFLHVRYATMLEAAGRTDDSTAELAAARAIDRPQADGWHNLFTIGSVRAFYAARENSGIAAPAELLPEAAVIEYLDKPLAEPPQ